MKNSIPAIRPAEEKDIDGVLELFIRHIDNSFFIGLGKDFLKIFPGSLIRSGSALSFVCVEDRRIVGFICAVTDLPDFLKTLFLKKWFALLSALLSAASKKPAVLKELWRGLLYGRRGAGSIKTELLYIAVEPDFRSRGLASGLIGHTLMEMKKRGIREVRVSTDQSNSAINSLLGKSGFTLERSFELFGKSMYSYNRQI